MDLDASSFIIQKFFLSNSSFSFIVVSNLDIFKMLFLSRWFFKAENFYVIYVVWSDMVCICVLVLSVSLGSLHKLRVWMEYL